MTKLNFTKDPINPTKLCDEILVAIGKKLYRSEEGEVINGDFHYVEPNLTLDFDDDLTAGEITQVTNVVNSHVP